MKTEKILKRIHKEDVMRYCNNQICHALLCVKKGHATKDQLSRLISIRYQLAHFFEEFLQHVMKTVTESSLPDNQKTALYNAVHENYLEEVGENLEYGGPHSEGRETLLNALGYDYEKWQQPLGSFQNPGVVNISVGLMIEKIKNVVDRGPIEAMTVLWYYENRISLEDGLGDYYIILSAFEKAFPEFKKPIDDYKEGDVLWHLASHAFHDTYHAQLVIDGFKNVPYTAQIHHTILSVCIELRTSFDWFWNVLWSEVNQA